MSKDLNYYRIPYDGAPMKCFECGVSDDKPKVKLSDKFGARHPECVKNLDQYVELSETRNEKLRVPGV